MGRKRKLDAMGPHEFLSLVSHEIKNPLTSIAGYTCFAEEAVRNHDAVSALENLEIVRSETRRVLRLAEDLLDAEQVNAGKFSVKMEPVDLEEIVWQIAARYAANTGRKIEVKTLPDPFPSVIGDTTRLGQVLENLVSNATKYSPEETPIFIFLIGNESRVALSVWNGGPAIPEGKLPLLFQRFSRLHTHDGQVHQGEKLVKGTGLGLYISKQIIEQHGGSIRVFSNDLDGTIFTVEMPQRAAAVVSYEISN